MSDLRIRSARLMRGCSRRLARWSGVAVAAVLLLSGCSASRPATTRRSGPTTRSSGAASSATTAPVGATAELPQPPRLEGFAFLDPSHGWLLYYRSGGGTCGSYVGETSDGGAHLGPLVLVEASDCGSGAPAALLGFDNHGDGFVEGSTLHVTHDGGRTWGVQTTAHPAVAIAALGYSVWMLEEDCPHDPAQTGPCQPVLVLSDDGGRSWHPSPSEPPPTPSGPEIQSRMAAMGDRSLVRTGSDTGFVVGAPPQNPQGGPASAPLWRTTDAGRTWTTSEIPCRMPAWYAAVSAAADGTPWAVCAGQPAAGSQLKTALISTDSGSQWQLRARCQLPSAPGATQASCLGRPPDSGYLDRMDAVSSTTAYLVGARSSLEVSRDGGAMWAPVEPLIASTAGGTSQVVFFDTAHGLVLGDDDNNNETPTLWNTSDNGAHWSSRVPALPAT